MGLCLMESVMDDALTSFVFEQWDLRHFFIQKKVQIVHKTLSKWRYIEGPMCLPQPWFRSWLYENIGYQQYKAEPFRYYLASETRDSAMNDAQIRRHYKLNNFFWFIGDEFRARIHFGNPEGKQRFEAAFGESGYPHRFYISLKEDDPSLRNELSAHFEGLPLGDVRFLYNINFFNQHPTVSLWLRDEAEAMMFKMRFL